MHIQDKYIEFTIYGALSSVKGFCLSPSNAVYQNNSQDWGGWISATEAAKSLCQSPLPWLGTAGSQLCAAPENVQGEEAWLVSHGPLRDWNRVNSYCLWLMKPLSTSLKKSHKLSALDLLFPRSPGWKPGPLLMLRHGELTHCVVHLSSRMIYTSR